MSTWLQDIRKHNPALADAYAIVGNRAEYELRNTIKALSLHPFLNDKADTARLNAAKFILRHKLQARRNYKQQLKQA